MSKIIRKTAKQFGSTAPVGKIAQFGSLAAGSPMFSTDPDVIQALGNWLTGWTGAVIGPGSPAIEDMNAGFMVAFYQLAYLMQEGIAEWDAGTTYYIGSLAQDGSGNVYSSITDNNLNNALSDNTNWTFMIGPSRSTGTTVGLGGVALSNSSGTFNTNSISSVLITNMTITITTAGRPVFVGLTGDGTMNSSEIQIANTAVASTQGAIVLQRNATTIHAPLIAMSRGDSAPPTDVISNTIPSSSIYFIDTPAAGTWTYTARAGTTSGAPEVISVVHSRLIAYEL